VVNGYSGNMPVLATKSQLTEFENHDARKQKHVVAPATMSNEFPRGILSKMRRSISIRLESSLNLKFGRAMLANNDFR